jgi:hypothetical protein
VCGVSVSSVSSDEQPHTAEAVRDGVVMRRTELFQGTRATCLDHDIGIAHKSKQVLSADL